MGTLRIPGLRIPKFPFSCRAHRLSSLTVALYGRLPELLSTLSDSVSAGGTTVGAAMDDAARVLFPALGGGGPPQQLPDVQTGAAFGESLDAPLIPGVPGVSPPEEDQ